jgi:NADH-quinone oxidoreductase subunit N
LWDRPWLAAIFTAALFSLAGIPLTAGFIGKFLLIAAGIGSAYWFLVILLVIASAIGLFYYLRIVVIMYIRPQLEKRERVRLLPMAWTDVIALGALVILLIGIGVYPSPLIHMIQVMAASLG